MYILKVISIIGVDFWGDCNLNSVQKTIYFVLWIETVKSTS